MPASVRLGWATETSIRTEVMLTGSVEALSISEVACEVSGKVELVNFEAGDYLEQGALLIQLATDTLEISLRASVAHKNSVLAKLQELQSGSRDLDVLAGEALLRKSEASLFRAQREYDRIMQLFTKSAVSQKDFDNAEADLLIAQQQVESASATYLLLVEGPRQEEIDRARADLQQAEAEVARVQDQLDKTTVLMPFDGWVIRKLTEVGQWITSGGQVAQVADLSSVYVRVDLSEQYIDQVSPGAPAHIVMDALPNDSFSGEVFRIVPMANETTRTYPVRILLENDDGRIKVGMVARVTLEFGQPRKALVVPKDAVVTGLRGSHVCVVKPDQTVAIVPVNLLQGYRQYQEIVPIEGSLQAGDRVVIRGNERLRPGQTVVEEGTQPPKAGS